MAGTEVLFVGQIAFRADHLAAALLDRRDQQVLGGAAPVIVEMQDRDLLQAEVAHEVRQQRHLVLLVDGVAPDEVAALGEIRMRIGEAELHEAGRLIDRRGRHRGRAGEVADLDHDALVGDVFARDRHGLARVALAVLEHIGERPPVDSAGRVDLVERDVEALFSTVRRIGRIGR
jgi:hypothetical protein